MAKLESLGEILELVVGAFGEASCDLDRVITALAESTDFYLSQVIGKLVTDGWRSVIVAQNWRYFSLIFVRVQAACLISRLGHLCEGAIQAVRRRIDLMDQEDEEERARREAEAYLMTYLLLILRSQ